MTKIRRPTTTHRHRSSMRTRMHMVEWNLPQMTLQTVGQTYVLFAAQWKLICFKFVRFTYDDDDRSVIDSVVQLLDEQWKIYVPRLIVSIIGCYHKHLTNDRTEREVIREEIFDVRRLLICMMHFFLYKFKDIAVTKTWILTYGNNVGISQVVGDIGRENDERIVATNAERTRHPIIAIMPWGNVVGRSSLVSTTESLSKVISSNSYSI